ncbi:MAG TPA: HEAT repeat domain-containing protein [Verrucomicrobiae bacterium]|nr:HEAT repeat domain-containing protein [Verrucomicrobiae bacterium]
MRRFKFWLIGILSIYVLLPLSHGEEAASPSADTKLQVAYQRLHFDRLYPPTAVSYIQGKLQSTSNTMEVLAGLAKDDRSEVRVLVTALLGEFGEPDGGKILWRMTRDETESVRMAAAGALTRLSQLTPLAISTDGLKDERADVRRLTAAALRQSADRSAESALIDTIRDPDDLVRMEVVSALAECGTAASVPSLAEALRDKNALVRTAAASTLAHFDGASSIPVLIGALDDPDWHVRATVIMSLSATAGDQKDRIALIVEPIAAKLQNDPYALVRDRAADALAHSDDEKAIAALVRAIVSDDREARLHAHEAIIRSRAVSALPSLTGYLHHPNRDVREKIIRIFGEIGGGEQLPAVIEALKDTDPVVRFAAVQALRRLRGEGLVEALQERCNDADANVRAESARTLGNLGERTAVPKLVELLRDSNGFVRAAAAEALGKLGDRSATTALIQVLTGDKKQTAAASEQDGLVIGTQTGLLPEIARMKVVEEKIIAAKALGDIRDPASIDSLVEQGLRAEDAGLRAESAVSLGKIGEARAIGPLEAAVRPYYEAAPADTEGVTIVTGPIDEKVRLMKEKESRVRASVAWALGQIGDANAKEILTRAENDENSLVRDAAAEALAKVTEKQEKVAAGAANPPATH